MATMIWSVVCFTFYCNHRDTRQGKQLLFVAIILMSYCTFIRPAGLMIAVGGAAHLWFSDRREKRSLWQTARILLIWLVPPSLVLIGFLAHETMATSGHLIRGTYISGLVPFESQSMLQMLQSGLHKRISDVGRLLIPGMFKAYSTHESWLHITMFIYLPLFIAIAIAWYKQIRAKSEMLLWGLVPYLLLHINYSRFFDGARFLTPMLPVILLLAWVLLGTFKSARHGMLLILFVLHASIIIGLAIREQPKLTKIQEQWKAAAICVDIIEDDPGTIHSVKDVNNLELQVMILADTGVSRKRELNDVNLDNPRWVLKRISKSTLRNHQRIWKDQEFELLKRSTKSPSPGQSSNP